MMSQAQIEEAVELLIAARGDHRRLDAFPPSCRPESFEDGHAVQEAFVKAWSVPVAGYKIGCTSLEAQKMLGSPGPFPGRVFAPVLLKSPAKVAAKAFHRLGIEPEFAFTMARGLPARPAHYTREEVADAVAAVHGAIELVDSRWTDWIKAGIASIVADNGANGGLVLASGSCRSRWMTRLSGRRRRRGRSRRWLARFGPARSRARSILRSASSFFR
jgi:2-keto-4-pentenoate hydratase